MDDDDIDRLTCIPMRRNGKSTCDWYIKNEDSKIDKILRRVAELTNIGNTAGAIKLLHEELGVELELSKKIVTDYRILEAMK